MSDDVTNFLRSVEQLKDRRDEGDEARSREQEKVLQERKKERQARREERARSISPQKSSPANTPPANRNSTIQSGEPFNLASSPIPDLSAKLQDRIAPPAADAMDSVSPTKENEFPFEFERKQSSTSVTSPPPSAGVPTRTPTLSWQRRPTSQASERPKSRPLSMVAAENAAVRSSTPPAPPAPSAEAINSDDPAASRDQIAQALSSKDPTWFRQTAERGQNSAAFRRNQVEDGDTLDMSAMRTQSPGMARTTSTENEKDTLKETPSSPADQGRLGSPLPLTTAQQLGPPADITGMDGTTSGRSSPTRPASPTKGMGGFVQSAMMKRTDSVKRWSVNSPAGLNRAGSVASNRNSFDGRGRTGSPQPEFTPRPTSRSRDTNPRPTSSHSKGPTSHLAIDTGSSKELAPEEFDNDDAGKTTPPTSPSKTMDQRRWSPTKGSWLDAALNKPESPKPKLTPAPSNQPAWMVELNKSKAERAKNPSVDFGRAGPTLRKHEVKTGGLVRPAPMGATVKSPSLGGLPSPNLSADKPPTPGFRDSFTKSGSAGLSPSSGSEDTEGRASVGNLQVSQPKPDTPPKKDFRANLKPRQGSSATSEPVNELQNVFGKLRKAKVQNYVAPDALKNNILKGKAGLNMTGGPRPYEKKDDFKDAILKRKEEFKQAKEEGRAVVPNANSVRDETVPEALAKITEITRSRSSTVSHKREPSAWKSSAEPMPDLPEALAKRSEFNRTRSKSTVSNSRGPSTLQSPVEPIPKIPDFAGASVRKPDSSRIQSNTISHQPEPSVLRSPVEPSPRMIYSPRSSVPSVISPRDVPRQSVEMPTTAKVEEPKSTPLPTDEKETPATGRFQTKPPGKLANRFNPALAGLLARGPPGTGGAPSASSGGSSGASNAGSEPGPGPQLTHMTKNRPRGPRRKAPVSASKASDEKESPSSAPALEEMKSAKSEAEVSPPQVEESRPNPSTLPKLDTQPQSVPLVDSSRKADLEEKPKVISLVDSSKKRSTYEDRQMSTGKPISSVESPVSPRKLHEQVAALTAKSQQAAARPAERRVADEPPLSPSKKIHEQVAALAAKSQPVEERKVEDQSPSPRKLNMKRMSRFLDEPSQAEQKNEPEQTRSPSPVKRSLPEPKNEAEQTQPLSPIKREPTTPRKLPQPEVVDDKPAVSVSNGTALFGGSVATIKPEPSTDKPAPLSRRPRSPTKSGAQPMPVTPGGSFAATKASPATDKPLPAPLNLRPRSPTKSETRPLPVTPGRGVSTPLESPMRSPTKYASDVSAMLVDFFGSDRPARDYRADAADILMSRPKAGSMIKTQNVQLIQISGDGKKSPVPGHYERVLFEREMYLCSHTFTNEARRKVQEVYFWAGDEVPESSISDAQVFANREARSMGGTLIKLRQGKETSEFIQALGGIIIVRRGSSNKYDSLAASVLCGRQYLGQIVFDEVDFSPQGLCSGFPYLITQQGKCYLWKGRGSGVDELSCARLIGMDLALMGELIEVDEGSESDQFWQLFDGGRKASSADHWRLRPNYDKYCGRLFCSDSADRKQIIEIHPFSQADLQPSKIYVLDAFFEMYIIVGRHAQSQYASFHNALDFAQEYAILAAGMEDRPFVPISTVVLEGIPRDLRSVFRKWRDDASPTRMQNMNNPVTPSLKRGRSLRIVALNQALQALSSE